MPNIDLEPHEVRRGPLRGHPLENKAFKRAATFAAIWFFTCVIFGRFVEHGMPWWVIAAPAFAPAFLLAYIAISLDD